jgi:D-glycero-beta-D-manno-heptose 1-phosphate adenylyltransferase
MTVLTLVELVALREKWREEGLRCVLTNGVFDILHAGHATYLAQARTLGDKLIVALNSDSSVRMIKGPLRPIVPEADRALLIAALRVVDAVVIFAEPTAEEVLAALRPEIYVKGGDYRTAGGSIDYDRLPEARRVEFYGGQVELLPFAEGRSTSEIIKLIVERYRKETQE